MYNIAGLLVEAEGGGERFLKQAVPYTAEAGASPADISFRVTEEEVALSMPQTRLCEDDCRYIISGMRFYFELLAFDGFMLHSSAVAAEGRAYLFSGPSGVGKSTHTGNWLKLIEGSYILNDDKPAIRQMGDGKFYAFGTPWSGKHDISRNEGLPLAGVAFIERAETNSIERIPPLEAAGLLLSQTVRNIRAERMNILLELINKFIAEVPVYRLRCTADVASAELSHEIMRRGSNED